MKISLFALFALFAFLASTQAKRFNDKKAVALPTFGASKEYVITAGFSSGAETSAHLMLAYPETFGCAGVLAGGFPLFLQRSQREGMEDYRSLNSDLKDYNILKGEIQQMVKKNQLADQSLLRQLNRAVYVFAGQQDQVVPSWATNEVKQYYQEVGATVKYESDPLLAHEFREDSAAKDIGQFCYDSMGAGVTLNKYVPQTSDFKNHGEFKKFDQFELAKSLSIKVPELQNYGYYYVPNACKNKTCKFQLTIHGCGMDAQQFSTNFGNYAHKNLIIMVFPQAKHCFMGDIGQDLNAGLNQVANDRGMMKFMKGIVDRATSPRKNQ